MARSAGSSEILQSRQKDKSGAGQARFDRLTDEGAKAYQAFTIYRDLPVQERSLAIVSQQLGKNKSLCARWSTKFQWVDRANAWDIQQDQLRRTRTAAEREKIRERQLQNSRVASQALMAPLIALVKLTQSNADAFSGASATELAKIASWAARMLPRMHEEERTLAARPEQSAKQDHPIEIAGAEFSWVQGRCTCGHVWDTHNHTASAETAGRIAIVCAAQDCRCTQFRDQDDNA